MRRIKSIALLFAGFILAATTVTTVLTSDADAARVRVRNSNSEAVNASDVKVIDAFTNSYNTFIDDIVAINSTGSAPNVASYQVVAANNETLQKHSFRDLNEEYLQSAEKIQSEAERLTGIAREVNETRITDIEQVTTMSLKLEDEMAMYGTSITAMQSAVGLYQQQKREDTEKSNNTFMIVVGAIIGAIVLAVIIFAIVAGKKDGKVSKVLFGTDPGAESIPKKDRSVAVQLYTSMLRYEKELKVNNKSMMDLERQLGYDLHATNGRKEALGKYRSIAAEYGALVALGESNQARALELLTEAESYRGDRNFYTETARNLTSQ